jgi:hypothetical protein
MPRTTAKDIEESRRIPERSEVKAVLDQYFVGPITDDIVTKLTDYVTRVMRDKPLHWGEIDSFHPRNRRGLGKAWREELSFDRTYPRSIDLAAWLASSTDGYPEPKPYCPDIYVGTWKDEDPRTAYTWEFASDGRFHTDEPMCAPRIHWCVHRRGKPGPKGHAIWLDDARKISHENLKVYDVTPTTLVVQPLYWFDGPLATKQTRDETYRLVRV